MPQVFQKYSNTLVRVSFVGGLLGLTALVIAGSNMSRSAYVNKTTVPLDQPIPFSHKHHVEELGIDCRYCHGAVEETAHAGVPATEVCMSCHSQVWTNSPLLKPVRDSYAENKPVIWNKVNDLPDFVYFNHSIHIAKGIGCNSCHAGIDQMHLTYKSQPFSMAFCLDCHRNPEKYIRPKEEVFNMKYRYPPNQQEKGEELVRLYNIHKEQLDDCWTCHR